MDNSQRFTQEIELHPEYNSDYLKYIRNILHKEVGIHLFDYLYSLKSIATVKIEEDLIKSRSGFPDCNDKLRITIEVSKVNQMQVTIPAYLPEDTRNKYEAEIKRLVNDLFSLQNDYNILVGLYLDSVNKPKSLWDKIKLLFKKKIT